MRVTHLSFDLDGTLINSIGTMEVAWNIATAGLGIKVPFGSYRRYIGLPFPKIMNLLSLAHYERQLAAIYFKETRARFNKIPEILGAKDILSWSKKSGYTTSIITSKPRRAAEEICKNLEFPVDLLICGDDFVIGKPDASLLQPVLCQFSLQPQQVVYFGDMIFDLQFAINAGMGFTHFSNGGVNTLPKNLINRYPTVDHLHDIPLVLAGTKG